LYFIYLYHVRVLSYFLLYIWKTSVQIIQKYTNVLETNKLQRH